MLDNDGNRHQVHHHILGGMNVNEAELKIHQIQTLTTLQQQIHSHI